MNNGYPENWPHIIDWFIIDWFILDEGLQSKYYLFFIGERLSGCCAEYMDRWKLAQPKETQLIQDGKIFYEVSS